MKLKYLPIIDRTPVMKAMPSPKETLANAGLSCLSMRKFDKKSLNCLLADDIWAPADDIND